MMRKYYILFFIALFLFVCPQILKSQNPSPESQEEALQKALEKIEARKAKELEVLLSSLKSQLDLAIREWLAGQKIKKDSELDKFIQQRWETLKKYLSPIHYDYYLRDYAYTLGKTDITKTESLIMLYKGWVNMTEDLFVERYHAPSGSNRDKYLFTISRGILISFEYDKDKFIVSNTVYEEPRVVKGWPGEVKRRLILR
jgi:hypothetical protein